MIVHHVLFRLKRPTHDEARTEFADALRRFGADAPFAVGPATVQESLMLRGESPRTADVLLTVTFHRPEDFASYLASAAHDALLRETLEPMCEGWWSVQAQA